MWVVCVLWVVGGLAATWCCCWLPLAAVGLEVVVWNLGLGLGLGLGFRVRDLGLGFRVGVGGWGFRVKG